MVLVENYAAHHQISAKCFNDPEMSDVVFEAKNGQTFHCEKFFLEVASPYFKKLFSSGKCGGSSKFVSAKDVEPAALKWILRACYTGDGDLDDDNVVSVMLAATMYEMDWVEKACLKYLKKDTDGPVATFEYSKETEKWQEWKVPQTGWYHIVAMGAKAADAPPDSYLYQAKGGEGAVIGASFELKADDVIQILTGGMSRIWANAKYGNQYTGGGGGTFVAVKTKEPTLLIAAGGGGSIHNNYCGCDASLSENGSGSACYPGGENGDNGVGSSIYTGGLGWKAGPAALAKPTTTDVHDTGGFGGGGDIGGGGGGYSGGGNTAGAAGGGGGGSFIAYQGSNSWRKIGNSNYGKVFIWGGKEIPTEEAFFLKHIGSIDGGVNAEAIDPLGILD